MDAEIVDLLRNGEIVAILDDGATFLITALIICLFPPIAMALKLMLRRIINETDEETDE